MSTSDRPSSRVAPALNVANVLTLARLAMVPAFAVLLWYSGGTRAGWLAAATVVFVVAALTDYYDGKLARSRDLVTDFGKLADPIADKALTGTALVGLCLFGWVPWWVAATILAREVAVTVSRLWVVRHGVIAASRGGKVKTILQLVAICWYLWPWRVLEPAFGLDILGGAARYLMGTALVATVVTGVEYGYRAARLCRAASGRPAGG